MPTVSSKVLVIKNGTFFKGPSSDAGMVQQDMVVENGVIRQMGPGIARDLDTDADTIVIDATDKLVVPGFINAHYHSHDVLAKGTMEEEPLEWWVLRALPPSFPPRSPEELRVRTLLGALECLRGGITTVQDMITFSPFRPEHLETVLQAYESIGIRAVVGPQYADKAGLLTRPYWQETIPPEFHARMKSSAEPDPDFDLLAFLEETYFQSPPVSDRLSLALSPTAPESCSPELIARTADLSKKYSVPIFTHVLESKSMALAARLGYPQHDGSILRWLSSLGMLGPNVNLAHSVWLREDELDLLAETATKVVFNLPSNLKLKSGVPPVVAAQRRGISYALGCDNPSCSDAQNMFQAMKLTALLNAITDPEPLPEQAIEVFTAATVGGARAIGQDDRLGRLLPGYRADCYLIDLHDPAWLPFNDPVRQLVYAECGRGVETVIVDGEIVIQNGRSTRIDEGALREQLAEVMPGFLDDFRAASGLVNEIRPYLLDVHRQVWAHDVGIERTLSGRY